MEMDEQREGVGASPVATGLAGAEAPEPPSRLGSASGIPSAADLAEHWFFLILGTWRAVRAAVWITDKPTDEIADETEMGRRRVAGVIAGTVGNVTMRELHDIARATGHRLRVIVEKLPASAIEARRAAAENTDAVHESAVVKPDAQPSPEQS